MKKSLLIVLIVFLFAGCTDNKERITQTSTNYNYKASLIMAGDALIHNGVYLDAYQGNNSYDFKPMFEYIKPIVKSFDLAYYNQETIIGGKKIGLSTYPRFNSPEEIGDALIDTGFNMVSLANNHTLDRGETAIINSYNYWSDKRVITAGSYASLESRNNANIFTTNNIRIAFLSYTTTTNGLNLPNGKDYLVNVYSDEIVKKDIENLNNNADFIIVAMHWGNEYVHEPNDEQKRIANYLSSLGVNLIIGTHPHVIEPIEYINNTLVIYSLGNFISAQTGLAKRIGLLVGLDINKSIQNGNVSVKIDNIRTELIYTYYDNYKDFKVIPFNNLNNNLLNNYESIQDSYNNIVNKYYDGSIATIGS